MTAYPLTLADRLRVAAAVGGHVTWRTDPGTLRALARAIDYCNATWAAAEAEAQRRAARRIVQDMDRARQLTIWRDVLICMAVHAAVCLGLAAL